MRKVVSKIVMFFPFIALFLFFVYQDWVFTTLVICGIVLGIDILGWVAWFYELGRKIDKE